jgi:UDP-glucose 4-epimerase
MLKVLVTGSKGFIGTAITSRLRASGYEVYGLDNRSTSSDDNFFKVDIRSSEAFKVIQDIKPNVVVHAAAQIRVDQSFSDPISDLESNGFGTLNIVKASVEAGVTNFCYINSGGAIYDQTGSLPISESGVIRPLSPYGATKFLGEEYLRILAQPTPMNWSSLALSNCYGPISEHGKGVIYHFAKNMIAGKSPTIYGPEVTRDLIYIEDVCTAILSSILSPSMGRVNISSGIETSLLGLFKLISQRINYSGDPILLEPKPGEILRSSLSNEKAFALWGWAPKVDLNEGIDLAIGNLRLSS